MNQIAIDVDNILQVLEVYTHIKVWRSSTEGGVYAEITDAGTRIAIIPEEEQYYFQDEAGTDAHWYKTSYYNSATFVESQLSAAIPAGGRPEKLGYTFNNYTPPPGEWGKLYTADDMRYTMLFGIDCIGSDIAQTEWTDEQFDQVVLEAVAEFEAYLTCDIRRRVYKTNPASSLVRGRLWREGVDFTHRDMPYEFDPIQWNNYGFIQLRHWPVLSVERAIWYSPVKGQIMDMRAANWLRLEGQFGQVYMFPTGGFAFGPYSVYGPFWSGAYNRRYPNAFEFDYTTGVDTSDFVDEGLRNIIAKYAAIKALATIGDGLIAGFSSQSVSLDGLSESFSSTQSATSAYFGARIKEYQDEIKEWFTHNRYKYAPIPMSFVGV